MAEKITIKCEKCGKQFSVPSSMAGKKAKCPCGNIVTVKPAQTVGKVAGTSKWYYAKGGERFGPIPLDEVLKLRKDGSIADNDLVWRKGLESWQPAANVDEVNPPEPEAAAVAAAEAAPAAAAEESAAAAAEASAAAEAEADDRQWHYSEGGQQNGPVGTPELQQLIQAGQVSSSALVWTDGWENWSNITEVDVFTNLLGSDAADADAAVEQPISTTADTIVADAAEIQAQYEAEQMEQAEQPAQALEAQEVVAQAAVAQAPATHYAAPVSSVAAGTLAAFPATTLYGPARSLAGLLGVLGFIVAIAVGLVGIGLGVKIMKFKELGLLGIGVIACGVAGALVSILIFKGISELLKLTADVADRDAELVAMMQGR